MFLILSVEIYGRLSSKFHLEYVFHERFSFHISDHVPIAVLEVGDGVFEVLSTSGDTHLGGDDFDKVYIIYPTFVLHNLVIF